MKKYIIIGIIIGIGGIGMVLPKLLKKKVGITSIQKFRYFYTKGYCMNAEVIYTLECNKNCEIEIKPYLEPIENTKKIIVEKDFVEKLESILKKYKVGSWNDFHKANKYVLDGDSFSINITFQDQTTLSASGYMEWPKNYGDVKKEIEDLFAEQLSSKEKERNR